MSAGRNALLEVRNLRLVRGDRRVLDGVDLTVDRGEVCVLMGLSGSGKTTVLRAAVALEAFDGGRIGVEGFELRPGPVPPESRLKELRRRAGMVFQAHALFEHLTALANTTLAPVYAHGRTAEEARARSVDLLESLGVGHRASAYPRELSGGEAQRVAIARALAVDPPLLLMDEPTASLDPARRGALGEVLRSLAGEGRGLLVTTHDAEFARRFADRVVVLAAGRVAEEGDPSSVLTNPQHAATKELLEEKLSVRS
ncbi:MAG: ATP-binding cassette domain-containing protein [Acidobacteria bacterium]|nr:ATP-binding cassette domain-containing protein [Acidobacteriota bacterium]MCA1609466.1 ATP-binding cassette domain-containing protein [Acidobacteriota bacterium]